MLSIIADYLQDTLFELAFRRKHLLIKVSNLYEQVAINLLKIAIFGQESTWKHEFETLIESIGELKLKDYKAKLSAKQYYNKLFDEPFEPLKPWNNSYVYNVIVGRHILKNENYTKSYHMPITEQNITIIHNKIKELIKNISNLLSERFLNNNNVQKLTEEYVEFWINYAKTSK
jgi:hypothetical protein